jgi:CxxC-x17-CxxC domain-containing protein
MGHYKELDIRLKEQDVDTQYKEGRIRCAECKTYFTLKDGEVEFYVQKELNIPKRCQPCRLARKNGTRPVPINKSDPQEVECDHCYRLTEVNFTPKPNSTVYCRVCWEGIKNVGKEGAVYI